MKRVEKIVLDEPVELRGKQVTEIEVRRPTVADEEDAMEQAIQLDKADNRITLEICIYSRVTGLKYEVLRKMDADDFVKIRTAYARVVAPLAHNAPDASSETGEQQENA